MLSSLVGIIIAILQCYLIIIMKQYYNVIIRSYGISLQQYYNVIRSCGILLCSNIVMLSSLMGYYVIFLYSNITMLSGLVGYHYSNITLMFFNLVAHIQRDIIIPHTFPYLFVRCGNICLNLALHNVMHPCTRWCMQVI